MTPAYFNPQHSSSIPFLELKGDQQHGLQVTRHVHDLATSNGSCFSQTSLNSHRYSSESVVIDYSRHAQEKVEKIVLSRSKPNDLGQVLTASSWPQNAGDGGGCSYAYQFDQRGDDHKIENMNNDQKHPKKWKPSKVRIVQKMVVTSKNNHEHKLHHDLAQRQSNMHSSNTNESNNGIRACTDCHTTTTPLWRSGPQGPKSLCNACGIRQRKARRAAMAAAAAAAAAGFAKDGSVASSISSSTVEAPKPKVQEMTLERELNHDKTLTLPVKKRSKPFDPSWSYKNAHNGKKLSFEDFALSSTRKYITTNAKRAFPRDEEEGAMLLMALSCGLACST